MLPVVVVTNHDNIDDDGLNGGPTGDDDDVAVTTFQQQPECRPYHAEALPTFSNETDNSPHFQIKQPTTNRL